MIRTELYQLAQKLLAEASAVENWFRRGRLVNENVELTDPPRWFWGGDRRAEQLWLQLIILYLCSRDLKTNERDALHDLPIQARTVRRLLAEL